jgi:hypothetical protein
MFNGGIHTEQIKPSFVVHFCVEQPVIVAHTPHILFEHALQLEVRRPRVGLKWWHQVLDNHTFAGVWLTDGAAIVSQPTSSTLASTAAVAIIWYTISEAKILQMQGRSETRVCNKS